MKNIWFLSGLQRSGATLLSSILNQNPSMWVSPASPLFRLLAAQASTADSSAEHIDYRRDAGIEAVMNATGQLFYSDKSATNIGDKNLNWQTPLGLSLAYRVSENPKIVCPVRSIPEILASFDSIISSVDGNENNAIDTAVQAETIPVGELADRRADWLMRHDKDITICLNGMKLALNPQLRHMFHFVEYNDLVSDPKKAIDEVYDFLELEKYDHEFQNIVDPTGISEDSPVTRIKHLHRVRPKIEKKSRKPEEVLSEGTIRRYSGLEFWRELK